MSQSSFFSRQEWRGFWITFFISLSIYVYTLAPSVTLEDSGEFLTAAYHLGVPHPPGYPIWAASAFLFEHLIPFGNAAWRVNFMSAVYGAFAAAMLSLITCKLVSKLWNLERLKNFSAAGISKETLTLAAGIVSGLIFSLIDTVWSQAVITEVYTLNAFFFNAICLVVLRWFYKPQQLRWPCFLALFFGLGITNHQTLLVVAPAIFYVIWIADRVLCRDVSLLTSIACTIFAWQSGLWFIWIFVGAFLLIYLYLLFSEPNALSLRNLFSVIFSLMVGCFAMAIFTSSDDRTFWIFLSVVFCIVWIGLLIYDFLANRHAIRSTAPFLLSFLMFVGGSSFYLYMPLSSHTNPPMNWGYTRTVEGFRHHITRGQYERIQTTRPLKILMGQFNQFFKDLQDNFSIPLVLLGVLALIFFFECQKREKEYLAFTVLCFFFMGFVLVYLMNPKFDEQSRFINRVFYSLSHGVYSLWIGLGLVLLVSWAEQIRNILPLVALLMISLLGMILGLVLKALWVIPLMWWTGALFYVLGMIFLIRWKQKLPLLMMLYALPLIPLVMNWADSEMRGHDFGWRYGHDMLKNLDRDAVVYGGTDPGRFVPTFMIFVESFQSKRWKRDPDFDRRDLYIITQNALADQTYMNYIRDHYDTNRPKMDRWYHKLLGRDKAYPQQPLKLPNDQEFNTIFQEVVKNLQNSSNSGGVTLKPDGQTLKASVQGIEAVFMINGAIARWIFEQNRAHHTFYVEESYPITWMYPYLEPAGLILKLNKEPLKAIDPKVIEKDMAYWSSLLKEFIIDPTRARDELAKKSYGGFLASHFSSGLAFLRDDVARKSFSKLRSSIGNLYAFRGLNREAEMALKQAIQFYPSSAEARSRLTEVYMSQGRVEEAIQNCKEWMNLDPLNPAASDVLGRVLHFKSIVVNEMELASIYESSKDDPNFVFQYAKVLRDRNKVAESDKVIDQFLNRKSMDLQWWQSAINFYAETQRADRLESILLRLTQRDPKNSLAWYNLAALQAATQKTEQAMTNLQKAFKLDANLIRNIQNDARFANIRGIEKFQKLIQ